jgi:hypothetical protein
MSLKIAPDTAVSLPELSADAQAKPAARPFLKSALLFVLIGAVIYLALYAVSEQLVYSYAKRNRFFEVKTTPYADYDFVILGASHAAALDYADMTPRLAQMTGAKIINLSEVGAGITVNRLLLDYFFVSHRTKSVVYVADSFAFYSPQWNEERLNDTRLLLRAPFDPALVRVLAQDPAGRVVLPDYILGFSKINNPDRLAPDINDDERTKFDTTYRPVKQIDQQRLDYLYPNHTDPAALERYLGDLSNLVAYLSQKGIRLIVVKPPVPARYYQMLPDEAQFDERLKATLARSAVEFHDFSQVMSDDKYYFNTDHLNRTGVQSFFDGYFAAILAK